METGHFTNTSRSMEVLPDTISASMSYFTMLRCLYDEMCDLKMVWRCDEFTNMDFMRGKECEK